MQDTAVTITVIGSVALDTLLYPDGRIVNSLGGLLYHVITFASLSNFEIFPVANVGEDAYDSVLELLSKLANVRTDGIYRVPGPHVRSYTMYVSDYGTQCDVGTLHPLEFSQVAPFLDAHGILITFPTGGEIGLSTLKNVRRRSQCPMYLDYGKLALGRDSVGNRYLRRKANWWEWVSVANLVQFNSIEAGQVWGTPIHVAHEAVAFGLEQVERGLSAVIITLDAAGSVIVHRTGSTVLSAVFPTEPREFADTTGCGDVYSASFLGHYLIHGNMVDACAYATTAASRNTAVTGLPGQWSFLQNKQS